ncbi:MAG: N-acetyltransferase [Anaerolineales bacterium]|nr:N-acetyltransferase [Anaerolineales bacterium]
MIIREATHRDDQSIESVILDAFDPVEGPVVAKLALDLLVDDTAKPVVALVAEHGGKILGVVIFSAVAITGHEGVSATILAPLAVMKEAQRKGVGLALIEHGMNLIKQAGAGLVLVLGDPNYYSRSGFVPEHKIDPPYQLPYPEAWMAREFVGGLLNRIEGTARCADSLNAPEYW